MNVASAAVLRHVYLGEGLCWHLGAAACFSIAACRFRCTFVGPHECAPFCATQARLVCSSANGFELEIRSHTGEQVHDLLAHVDQI